ncbi:hypothetical protein GCM10009658_55660 [Planotetraspora silvatica]
MRIRITPAPNPNVTVDVDVNDGGGFQQVLSFAAPQPVPASYSFGFAASTGLFTDVHLIRQVRISSLEPFPPNPAPRPSAKQKEPSSASASGKQQSGGIVRSKNENFTGVVATTNGGKVRKKLRDIDAFIEHVKHRHLDSALTKHSKTTGPRG